RLHLFAAARSPGGAVAARRGARRLHRPQDPEPAATVLPPGSLPGGGLGADRSGDGAVPGCPVGLNHMAGGAMSALHTDFVIVGGGSAGSALANRLSADPANRVLVLEAGRPDYPFDVFIHMPAALTYPIGSRFYDWKYESEPEPFMNGRKVYHARGKGLGGPSSINGMIFQRGNPLDYERWAADPGMKEWDYAHCLPYFKKMETCLAGGGKWRGHEGPLVLERGPATSPLFQAFFQAVQEAGYSLTDDVNGYRQEGLAPVDPNVPPRPRPVAPPAPLPPGIAPP